MLESLDTFREAAEQQARVPAFETIETAGRRRRLRRHAVVGAMAACVLGASGLLATAYDRDSRPQPAGEPDGSSLVTPFPVGAMTTLEEGTYELEFATSRPRVRFTLPAGWNSWVGPNRFEGMSDGTSEQDGSNEDVLDRGPAWVLGMLPLEVEWIARPGCTMADMVRADTATVVDALTDIPRLEVVSGPDRGVAFGHPVVHLRLREQGRAGACPNEAYLNAYPTSQITYLGRGTTYDAWVIDLDGVPLLIWAAWTRDTPDEEVDDLMRIVETVEVVQPDR